MQKIGIICEYNPFHNGHIYHIQKIKELYPDSLIILVLNGYFLQRGEISILSKYDKVAIALENNVDLVLELPFIFGTQSADTFAMKAIEILNYMQAQFLIFGSETNNLKKLNQIADLTLQDEYDHKVQINLKKKMNYPTALAQALDIDFDFHNPNDLLAISYLKAIKKSNSKIQALSIKRTSSYHDLESKNPIISASNLRHKLQNKEKITDYLPSSIIPKIKTINEDLLFTILKYKIKTTDDLAKYLDVDEGIENRLKKVIDKASNLDEFMKLLKTKRYTYNKLQRMLSHILVDFKKTDNLASLEYIRVLGFNKLGQNYLNSLKKEIKIPLKPIYKSKTYHLEQKAIFIYDLLTNSHEKKIEQQNKPLIF